MYARVCFTYGLLEQQWCSASSLVCKEEERGAPSSLDIRRRATALLRHWLRAWKLFRSLQSTQKAEALFGFATRPGSLRHPLCPHSGIGH